MCKAEGSLTLLQVGEVRHPVERGDGFANSRDCAKEAPTGTLGVGGELRAYVPMRCCWISRTRGGRRTLRTMDDSGMVAGDANALIYDELI